MTRIDLLDLMNLPDAPRMNDDLAHWAEQGAAVSVPPKPARGMFPCRACAAPTRYTCTRCDNPVCPAHRGAMTGLCDSCIGREGDNQPRAKPAPDGSLDDEHDAPHPDLDVAWVE